MPNLFGSQSSFCSNGKRYSYSEPTYETTKYYYNVWRIYFKHGLIYCTWEEINLFFQKRFWDIQTIFFITFDYFWSF